MTCCRKMLRKGIDMLLVVLMIAMVFGSFNPVAHAGSLTEAQRAEDTKKFEFIDEKKPVTQIQLQRYDSGFKTKQTGMCNVSSLVTLLNRRLAYDGVEGTFLPTDVLKSLGCKNISSSGVKYSYTGKTSDWLRREYSNGSITYSTTSINGSEIKKKCSKNDFYEYIANLLHQHPEGIAIRNTKANHVAVIYKYTYSNGKYQLYVKDPVKNYSGKLEDSYIYKQSGKDLYSKVDFIVYIKSSKKITTAYKPAFDANGEKYPTSLQKGSNFGLRGVFTVNSGKITSVSAKVVSGSKTYYTWSAKPNSTSFDVNGTKGSNSKTLNSTIGFASLPAGNYTLTIEMQATNSVGTASKTVTKSFAIKGESSATTTKPGSTGTSAPTNSANNFNTTGINKAPTFTVATTIKYPTTISKGSSFGLRGVIKVDCGKITKVEATVKNNSGKTMYSYSATPNSNSFDVNGTKGTNGRTINNTMSFGKLAKGTYTYTITVTATNNGLTNFFKFEKSFTVK